MQKQTSRRGQDLLLLGGNPHLSYRTVLYGSIV